MSVQAGLLDTNTVILLQDLDAATLPDEALISTVTLAELSVGSLVAEDDRERATRQGHLQQAEADFDPLPFDVAAARAYGRIAATLRSAGHKRKARAFDALIAATAVANDLPLYTCKPADFENIEGLDLRPVPHPGSG